jgi:hypothetical protein
MTAGPVQYHRPVKRECREGVIFPAEALSGEELATHSPPRSLMALLDGAMSSRRVTSVTYARAWGRKLSLVEQAPDEEGGRAMRRYVPHPIDSLALRVQGVCWMVWTRLDGDTTWKPAGAMAVWQGQAYRVTHTQAGKHLRRLTERA